MYLLSNWQVTSPVQWETTVKTLLNKGLKKSYELGPGKVGNLDSKYQYAIDIEDEQPHVGTVKFPYAFFLICFFCNLYQVIAGIVKRMDKGADIENIGA